MTQSTIMQQTIIDELGFGDLPQDKKEELLAKTGELIMKRIYLETMENLEKADQDKLIDLMEKNPEGVETFLKEKFPDYDNFVKKVVEDFKNEMKEDMGLVKPGGSQA